MPFAPVDPKRASRNWIVAKEYYRDDADPSWFVHNDDSMPVLYVQMIYL